jgi:hypothetical protein
MVGGMLKVIIASVRAEEYELFVGVWLEWSSADKPLKWLPVTVGAR